jgi:Uma2 family endonuclease
MAALQIRQIRVPPGQRVLLDQVSWADFENILADLGEHRSARVAYSHGTLEIMAPLPEHESAKEHISDLVKALLEELDIEFLALGSTPFKNELMEQGIEPDQCFYIQNEAAVRGKDRLDLQIDPPPDLAIEIDVTSRTHPDIYRALRVPELWRFEKGALHIYHLQGSNYSEVSESSTFPGLALQTVIPQYARQMKTAGRNRAMKAFRGWLRERLG